MKVEDFFKYENKDIVNFDFSQEVLRNTNVKKEYNEVKKLYLGNSLDYLSKYLIFKTTFSDCLFLFQNEDAIHLIFQMSQYFLLYL